MMTMTMMSDDDGDDDGDVDDDDDDDDDDGGGGGGNGSDDDDDVHCVVQLRPLCLARLITLVLVLRTQNLKNARYTSLFFEVINLYFGSHHLQYTM